MVASLWFSASLGSNYNAGRLPDPSGVPVDPIATPSALLSKGVYTSKTDWHSGDITIAWSDVPVVGDWLCIETSGGTNPGQYIVRITAMDGNKASWATGTQNGITGVATLPVDGTFVRCGVNGPRLALSADMFTLGGCLSQLGTAKMTVANNLICWLDGSFDVVAPTRTIMIPNLRGLPEFVITVTSGTSLTTQARSYISLRNGRIVGTATIGKVETNSGARARDLVVDAIASVIDGMYLARNSTDDNLQRASSVSADGYNGLRYSAYRNIPSEIALSCNQWPNSLDPMQVEKSILHWKSAQAAHGFGCAFQYTSGAGKCKDSILKRDDNNEGAAMALVYAGYCANMDEQYNDMLDASLWCSTYDGTDYKTTPRAGSNNVYSADQKWSVNADGYIVLAADSPCVGTASDGANKGPCNIVITGDAAITVTKGQSSSASWTITDAAGTSSVIKPYISTGTLPAGLSLSSHGYSPLTVTFPGTCTADAGTYNVTLRGSNAVTASYKSITITVVDPHVIPVADAGADQSVGISETVNLDGSGSTDAASYSWVQTGGAHTVTLVNPTTATPHFTSPAVDDVLTFDLTVTSSTGDTDTDSVTITVAHTPTAPTSDAGPDQSATEGDTVQLDGTGSSDPYWPTLTYAWTQISGETVTLSDATDSAPTFEAPAVAGDLVFRLTVTNSDALTDTDEVTVTISLATVTLTLIKIGQGAIACDQGTPLYTDSAPYTIISGTTARIEAKPAHGYKFTAWSGAAVDSSPIITLTMDADKTLTGTFAELEDGMRKASLRMPPYRGRPIR